MEKLKKLKLGNNITQLSESEMKAMIGGNTSGPCKKTACSGQGDCSGYCADIAYPGIGGCIGSYCM